MIKKLNVIDSLSRMKKINLLRQLIFANIWKIKNLYSVYQRLKLIGTANTSKKGSVILFIKRKQMDRLIIPSKYRESYSIGLNLISTIKNKWRITFIKTDCRK